MDYNDRAAVTAKIIDEILLRRAKERSLVLTTIAKFESNRVEFEHFLPKGFLERQDDRRDWLGHIIKAASKELSKLQDLSHDLLYAHWAYLTILGGDGTERSWWACSEPFIYKLGTPIAAQILAGAQESTISLTISLRSVRRQFQSLATNSRFSEALRDQLLQGMQQNHHGREYVPAAHIREVLSPSCLGRLHAEQRWRSFEEFHSRGLFILSDDMEKSITHRCGKLLAAWLIAKLDLKSFWAAAQKDGDFSDQHLTLGLQAGSYLEQYRQDQHAKLVYMLEQNPALKHFFDNKPGPLQALSKAWSMVNPFRILKK